MYEKLFASKASEKFLKKIAWKVLKKLNFGIKLRFEGGPPVVTPMANIYNLYEGALSSKSGLGSG